MARCDLNNGVLWVYTVDGLTLVYDRDNLILTNYKVVPPTDVNWWLKTNLLWLISLISSIYLPWSLVKLRVQVSLRCESGGCKTPGIWPTFMFHQDLRSIFAPPRKTGRFLISSGFPRPRKWSANLRYLKHLAAGKGKKLFPVQSTVI